MRNMWTIARREYNHYFNSSIAYVVAFMILGVIGIVFVNEVSYYIQNAFQSFGSAPSVTNITGVFGFLLLFCVPAITMRLVSDENKMGTIELLLTAPLRDWEMIAGKWLGGLQFILTILAITLVFPIILNGMVKPGIDQRLMLSAYLGTILLSAAFLALGVGISSLFKSQIAAFFLSLFTFFTFWWLFQIIAQMIPAGSELLNYLSVQTHFGSMNRGVINLSDIVFFLSLTILGLFVGTTAVEMRRWR